MVSRTKPIEGPPTGSPQWYEARMSCIGASECAAACGVSESRQPLDVWLEKRGLVEPFEGNDYTRRGKRLEPFIAEEYTLNTGEQLQTGLPMYFHPKHRFIGATPDAVRVDDPRHLAEFKLCQWQRAKTLGEEYSDEIFEDWLLQAQQQMFVMQAEVTDLFVMIDPHTYKLFRVERNDPLIEQIVECESRLWDAIVNGDEPPADLNHPNAEALMKAIYGVKSGQLVELDEVVSGHWYEVQRLKAEAKRIEKQIAEHKAYVLKGMGESAIGRLVGSKKEVVRSIVKDSFWTPDDVKHAQSSVGKLKREGYVTLRERMAKEGK